MSSSLRHSPFQQMPSISSTASTSRDSLHTFACVAGAAAVGLGAFGAHGLKGKLTPHQINSWSTATTYGLIHSVALLYASSLPVTRASTIASYSFAAGITLFSGSIYGLCLTQEGASIRKVLGPATPFGGLAFIVGWGLLAFAKRGVTVSPLRV